jgi:hypothetical protein
MRAVVVLALAAGCHGSTYARIEFADGTFVDREGSDCMSVKDPTMRSCVAHERPSPLGTVILAVIGIVVLGAFVGAVDGDLH